MLADWQIGEAIQDIQALLVFCNYPAKRHDQHRPINQLMLPQRRPPHYTMAFVVVTRGIEEATPMHRA